MVHIRLFCNAGMSTSTLVAKMRKVADTKDMDVDIVAYGAGEAPRKMEEADVALIGPQIGYRKDEMQALGDKYGVPVEVMPMREYGMVNAEYMLDLAMKTYEERGTK